MRIRFSIKACSAFAVAMAMVATTLHADVPASTAELLKARLDHYRALGDANKTIRDGLRGNPDWAALEKAALQVQQASVNQERWFPKGSGPEAGKTRALPEIWSKPNEFAAAAKLFEEQTPKLVAAVQSKNVDAVNAALRDLGGSCKNCHDKFRGPEIR
jgi:cytochrome c556